MRHWFNSLRIRTRLLVAYAGILFVGVGALTLVAGQQTYGAAREDFEQRLQNEVRLIAQGMSTRLASNDTDLDDLNQTILEYEDQTGGIITIYGLGGDNDGGGQNHSFRDYPEIENAIRDSTVVIHRDDASGQERLYTAAKINLNVSGPVFSPIVQLSVPADGLQTLVYQRWLSLGVIFLMVAALAVVAATLLSRSIIQPLLALQDSAVKLSQGDLSHRVQYDHADEIGDVARAFNTMADQVKSMLEEQRAFASNTSHELRTPLTTIRLRTEALRDDPTMDAETTKQYITEIDDEVHRLGDLIEDLTMLSRFDAGRAELGKDEIDLSRFAVSLQNRLLPLAQAKHIQLDVVAPEEILPVRASLTHLTIVFRNLLENAIKYTPEGGKVTWFVSTGATGVRNMIEDNGLGIAPETMPHLFQRFYRADKARSRDVPGTGLGLAIAKSVVEAYGGTISIESDGIGKGTRVSVEWVRDRSNE